ncbi:unnamed protein product [Ectocarpus sp. 4 AP-2014]
MSCAGGVDELGVTGPARRGQPPLRWRLPLVACFLQILRCSSSAGLGGDGPTALRLSPLVQGAAGLLLENYRDELEATIPSPLIDAHQESTTSVMVAEAWAHIDQQRARAELLSIFRGQWENGLVPTVRYAPGYEDDFLVGSFLPGPGGWGGRSSENASSAQSAGGANTSSLAAIPLHAEAALRIFDLSPRDAEARLWLQDLFPALFRYHDYLHGSRNDPETGLVYVHHPWETEVSADSALWPSLLADARAQATKESWVPPPIPSSVSSVAGFPGKKAFQAALFLSDCSARHGRVDEDVQRECPFLLQDVQFNAALVRSDKALLELAGILEATRSGWQTKARDGYVYTPEQYERLEAWADDAESGKAIAHLWSPTEEAFLNRYTSTTRNETFLARPATSSGFSALLSPGLAPFKANAAIEALLSPGDVSFRCGDFPVMDLECGYGENASGGGWGGPAVVEGVGEIGGGTGRGGRGGGGGGGGGDGSDGAGDRGIVTGSGDGGAAVLFSAAAAGPGPEKLGAEGDAGQLESRVASSRRTAAEVPAVPPPATDFSAEATTAARFDAEDSDSSSRVWVLHNFLAVRGLRRLSLNGLSVWLANSTSSLLGNPPEGEYEYRHFYGAGADGGGGGEVDDLLFRFHRAFDGFSGLPLSGPEGNSSSLAAAASILLLLGDAPDGGNDFPPITHATLFVLVAVELAFSFAMGVSCLLFNVSLLRKLAKEDQPTHHSQARHSTGGGGGSNSGGGVGGGISGSIGDTAVGVARTKAEDGDRNEDQGQREGGADDPWRRRGRGSSSAASAVTAGAEFGQGRGIGSLLSRRAGSRVDLYYDDDSGEDYLETVAMSTRDTAAGGRADAGAGAVDSLDDSDTYSSSDGRLDMDDSESDGRGSFQHREQPFRSGQREGRAQEIPRPRSRTNTLGRRRRSSGVSRGASTAADEDEESRMALIGGGVGGTVGSGNAGSGGSGGRGSNRVGFVDLLRPFMASVKFW